MTEYYESILNDEPNYKIVWSLSIIVILISFLYIAIFYKYNKFTTFSGLVEKEGSDIFVQILVPYDNLGIVKNANLIINGIEQDYIYEVGDSIYSDNNKIYVLVKLRFNNNYEPGSLVDITFKSAKTTFVNEIRNKIRKGWCDLQKISIQDLKKITGGGMSFGIGALIGAGVVFLIGLLDGFVRPLKCN